MEDRFGQGCHLELSRKETWIQSWIVFAHYPLRLDVHTLPGKGVAAFHFHVGSFECTHCYTHPPIGRNVFGIPTRLGHCAIPIHSQCCHDQPLLGMALGRHAIPIGTPLVPFHAPIQIPRPPKGFAKVCQGQQHSRGLPRERRISDSLDELEIVPRCRSG